MRLLVPLLFFSLNLFGAQAVPTFPLADGTNTPITSTAEPSSHQGIDAACYQSTSPWVENLTQVASNNVVTSATGVQEVGIVGHAAAIFDAAQGAAAPANALMCGGTFNTSLPTISNGDVSQIQIDAKGQILQDLNYVAANPIVTGGVNGLIAVGGNVASGAADSANPVKVGGVFHSATQNFSDGNRVDVQTNIHGIPIIDATSTDVTGTFTSTGNTSSIDASGYGSISYTVDVSAASGTTPTLDVQLQESQDGSNDWTDVYDTDRFITTGSKFIASMKIHARYYRFNYVIGGVIPSFTFTVRTTLKPTTSPIRYQFNKFNDLVMTSSNNFSTAVDLDGCSFWSAQFTRGAGGAGVSIAPQFSNDGTNWVTSGNTTNTSASTTTIIGNFFAAAGGVGEEPVMTRYARLTNTNSQAAATTLDVKWYCKE